LASVQTSPDDMTGLYQALMGGVDPSTLPPVPEEGPYGPPAVTRDTGPQSMAQPPTGMNPLAVALSGGMPGAAPAAPPAPPPQPAPSSASPGFLNMLASALGGGGAPSTGSRYNPATGDFLPSRRRRNPRQRPPLPHIARRPLPPFRQRPMTRAIPQRRPPPRMRPRPLIAPFMPKRLPSSGGQAARIAVRASREYRYFGGIREGGDGSLQDGE
jgi:hypothetical protein